jgi:hypothetical protein
MLIAEIEGTIALDLLPDRASERLHYRRALETRAEGAENLHQAANADAMSLANDKLSRAVAGLVATRDALVANRDGK